MSEMKARESFRDKHKFELGNLKEVSTQVVAGVNYKMVFESSKGDYEMIVFSQPWTETYELTSVQLLE